jgi:hypothetical protein
MLEVVNGVLCAGGGYGQSQVPECLQPHMTTWTVLDQKQKSSVPVFGFRKACLVEAGELGREGAGHGPWPLSRPVGSM